MPPEIDQATLLRVWRGMREGDAFAVVLGELVATVGANMAALPAFAIVSRQDATARIIVRGSVQARIETREGRVEHVSALGSPTWTDRTIDAPVSLSVGTPHGESSLPLNDGVAAAAGATWALDDVTPASSLPVDEAVAVATEPVPEPIAIAPIEPAAISEPGETLLPAPSEETAVPDAGLTITESVELTYAPPVDELPDETSAYDDLIFGATRMSTVEDAAVRDEPDAEAESGMISGVPLVSIPPAAAEPVLGDHDGETISAEQLAALQAQLAGGAVDPRPPGPPAVASPAPTLIVSSGERVVLDRSAVVGRRPRAVRATGMLPHLVTVASPDRGISSNHVELRVEGTDVIAADLDTMNGTRLLRPGAEPVRLHPSEPTLLVSGDRLDLGDGVVLSFEGI
ncbi:MAG: FHA domain-containing protein [Microbacterium sp.]|uniref:FHA domain-containing protein n=1 Tax=Microbacterium sp. TaxID=51671 RepID=UPI00260F5C9C|nr:FHA domain-containing protein [Microbacterium sp.]MCX6501568.1 FHA domain-containing protein [Microbacterium sp.]